MAVQCEYFLLIFGILAVFGSQCNCLKYETGKVYKYTYDTKVLFNDHFSRKESKPQQDVGLHMTMEFDLAPVFQQGDVQMVKIQVTSATLTSLHRSGMEGQLMDMMQFPAYFEYENGIVGRVYTIENDSIFCTNIKKGIISMFQVQTEQGERIELDVSGECKTTYKISGPTIVKQKLKCENLEIAGQHSNENEVFGVSSGSSSTWTYQIENDIVHTMMGSNRHIAVLNMKTTLNAVAMAVQKLTFLSSGAGPDNEIIKAEDFDVAASILKQASNYPIVEMLLPSGSEIQQCSDDSCVKPVDVLKQVKDSLTAEKIATVESAKAFLELLKSLRGVGKDTIAEVMTNPDSYYIVPQLLDIGIATQTPTAQRAMMELLNFDESTNIQYPLRYLLGAAYTTHPGTYLIKDLLGLLKKKPPSMEIKSGLALALGAVVYTFCQDAEQCNDEAVKDYRQTVLELFKKCRDEDCKLLYIRSMGNSGQPQFMKSILQTIADKESSSMLGYTAVKSLRRIPKQYFTEKEVKTLLKIYHCTERTFDSSVRAATAELLLENKPTTAVVRNLLLATMSDTTQFELSSFLSKKIVDMAKYNPTLRWSMLEVLKDQKINNYLSWAQKGKSSAFSSLLAETQDTNATYGLYMEVAKSGVMKKSDMTVNLMGNQSKQKLLNFGIYASGLESLLGEEPDPDAGEEEATAGLGLSILDVLLPPVEFFRGSSGLMSAVWNAPSEPVSALQTSFLLQDHHEKFHLANGLVVDLQVLGVVSIDLTGYVSISLWNRNSESLIRNSGAMVVEGSMTLDSDIGKAGAIFTAEGEAFIDFATDVDFYESPFKMCMQMKRPKIDFKHRLHKYEKAKKFDRSYKSTITKTSHIYDLSYFLSQKNSLECKALLADK